MANTATWSFLMIIFFTVIVIVVGVLNDDNMLQEVDISTNPAINNRDNFPVFQATDYLISNIPVCSINGSVNYLDAPRGIIRYGNETTTLSDECYEYCEPSEKFVWTSFKTYQVMDCSGICWNATTTAGTNVQGCTVEGGESGIVDVLVGFLTFNIDLGLGSWNWIINLIFVMIPLMILLILIYLLVRSGSS